MNEEVENRGSSAADGGRGKRPALVAVDLGAESCRVCLLRWVSGEPEIRLVHRFPNAATSSADGLRWDLGRITAGVDEGLRACAQLAPEGIAAIGADGWAVDYVRLRADGKAVADPFCYRDERTVQAQQQVHARISPERLYELTGVQILALNTLYQLYADNNTDGMSQNSPWINLPEYLLHRLGGRRVSEYTNATHTQLLGVRDHAWCAEVFRAAGLEINAAPPVVNPGTDIGCLQGPLPSLPALRATRLIVPACHDTASAVAGIPALGDDWAFISSGTWSLVGCVLDSPCVSEAARSSNFSNEGGVGGKIYFLKNVNGMWLLRKCMEQWQRQGQTWTVERLIEACVGLAAPRILLEVDDPELLLPGDMPARINAQLSRRSKTAPVPGPQDAIEMSNLILHSLAMRYASVLESLTRITGKRFKRLYIVGGGSRNTLLNRFTGQATGLEVLTGSTESTAIGNFAVQLAALDGHHSPGIGVTATAVAEWARVLAARPIEAYTASAPAHKVEKTALRTGEALA
jgi:rhamnulokinase